LDPCASAFASATADQDPAAGSGAFDPIVANPTPN
jgi:hypothetical protein